MRVTLNKQQGFTISELIVVIVVMGILSTLVLISLGDFYYANIKTTAQTTQDTETRGVLRRIETTVTDAQGFVASVNVAAPLGPGNNTTDLTWSYKGTGADSRVFIATTIATDKAPTDDTRLPAFQNPGSGCSIDTGVTIPVMNIYFVAADPAKPTQKNLYRRTVVMPTSTVCSTPYQKNTCTSSARAAYPTVCQATDSLLLTNVTNFTVDYYTSSNDTAPIADQYSATEDKSGLIAAAKAARLSVSTTQKINGKDTTSVADIRVSRPY